MRRIDVEIALAQILTLDRLDAQSDPMEVAAKLLQLMEQLGFVPPVYTIQVDNASITKGGWEDETD